MNQFEISIIPSSNGMFTVYIISCNSLNGDTKEFEFCGSLPEVGDYIRTVTTQNFG